jgi:hypothetical protein
LRKKTTNKFSKFKNYNYMNKKIIFGCCLAFVVVGLSLANALTGHGVRGNSDLNIVVLATGSSDGSGSDGSGSGSGSTGTGTTADSYTPDEIQIPVHYGEWMNHPGPPPKRCRSFFMGYITYCIPGGKQFCIPEITTFTGEECKAPLPQSSN